MSKERRIALIGGALYLVTFVTSIPALALKKPYLDGSVAADSTTVIWAALLEIVLALSCIGTAVALYPVTRRANQVLAIGFVASRTLEAATIYFGVMALLALSTVRSDAGSADVADALVALHDWAFLIGPAVMAAVNAALLATLLFRARLVPRVIPALGLVGAPLLAISVIGVLFGLFTQVSVPASLMALPIAVWELSLGLWLTIKGWSSAGLARLPSA